MIGRLKFLFLYLLCWVVFFDLIRIIFLVYNSDKTQQLSFKTILLSFWHGILMDLSMACYILFPVCLFVLLSLFVSFFQKQLIYRLYTIIVLMLASLISVFDLQLYRAWGFRIDATPLRYLDSPNEALASVSHLPLLMIIGGFIFLWLSAYFSFRFFLTRYFFQKKIHHWQSTAFVIVIFIFSLVVPIRGGFQLAPLSQSSVYFSTNMYANHSAINPFWNFFHSYFNQGADNENPYQYLPMAESKYIADSLYADRTIDTVSIFKKTERPINVLLIIWESFTEKMIHQVVEKKEVTPRFNQLRKEGIFFSDFYASGDRTSKGIPAILSGYPALPATSIIHTPAKAEKLTVISDLFREKGYRTPFFYGGEPEFANIKSYLLHGGFSPIVGKWNFPPKARKSKWGVHDGVIMHRVFDELNKIEQPFFATWLTLSSHEPYEIPIPGLLKGSDQVTKFLNSHYYTDQVIGSFLEQCKTQPWWDNTLVIITGDHGHLLPRSDQKADEFRTPMLWLGGALEQKEVVVDKIVSQLDIVATLSRQLGMESKLFPFSRNIFAPGYREWAFFSFNNGFGFINQNGTLIYDNVGNQIVELIGNVGEKEIKSGKALMQLTYDDFLKK